MQDTAHLPRRFDHWITGAIIATVRHNIGRVIIVPTVQCYLCRFTVANMPSLTCIDELRLNINGRPAYTSSHYGLKALLNVYQQSQPAVLSARSQAGVCSTILSLDSAY